MLMLAMMVVLFALVGIKVNGQQKQQPAARGKGRGKGGKGRGAAASNGGAVSEADSSTPLLAAEVRPVWLRVCWGPGAASLLNVIPASAGLGRASAGISCCLAACRICPLLSASLRPASPGSSYTLCSVVSPQCGQPGSPPCMPQPANG